MLVEQAIFTSVRSGRNEGYQVAARSGGISSTQVRELSQWGPSHDSLYESLPNSECVNYHRMANGLHCVSHTILAGREYSGRGGRRVYTQLFLLGDELFARFGNSPFRVFDSLAVSGRVKVLDTLPAQLEPLTLLGRAATVNTANVEHVARKIGAHRLAALLTAALNTPRLGVTSSVSGTRLFRALFDLMPPALRTEFSVTTGLKVSNSRDYRLVVLPRDAEQQRRAIRQVHLDVLDLTGDPPSRFAPNRGWPQLMHQFLRAGQYGQLAKTVESSTPTTGRDIEMLAEQMREHLESEQASAITSL